MKTDHPIAEAFLGAAKETFETMAMMELELESVEVAELRYETLDYTATMGLCRESGGEGLLVVSLSEDVAANIVAAMLGMDPSEVADDIVDGVGEIANMVAGAAKTSLHETPHRFDLSIPAVLAGSKISVVPGCCEPGIHMSCRVNGLKLVICVWMEGASVSD